LTLALLGATTTQHRSYRVRARDARSRVMHANTETLQTSTRFNPTTMGLIEATIETIESLGPGASFTYTEVAKPMILTISQRHKVIIASHEAKIVN
jgi:hypothetical protein